MQMITEFHAPAALPPKQQHSLATEYEIGWAPEVFWTIFVWDKTLLRWYIRKMLTLTWRIKRIPISRKNANLT